MAHLHKKIKNGRTYYYIRESTSIQGKTKILSQVYLGTLEKILSLAANGQGSLERIQVQEFGALWLANHIENEVGLVDIVDAVIPQGKKESGPTVGEYFLYAAFNRMIDACSKRALPEWYKTTAIQHIRPTDIAALDSDHFWKKWEKVGEEELRSIAGKLFDKIARIAPSASGCFLFDTTNYYTYMASDTPSELAMRGKNKDGHDWLRQVGLALLVARDTRLPLFYKEYEGNCHDSKLFGQIMDEMLGAMRGRCQDDVTVVFDKGMNSEENISAIDAMEKAHFVTTYSTYFAEELVHIDIARFVVVDTQRNKALGAKGREDDQIVAWRTTGEYWGKERAVLVTYNPLTATKQRYGFEKRLAKLQAALFDIRSKVRAGSSHWKKSDKVLERYRCVCKDLHLPRDLYDLDFVNENCQLSMSFRKNHYRIGRHIDRFGKNIIITDHHDWSTEAIVQANLDRYVVEEAFRQTKDDDLVSLFPIRHWTDGKIRCHIFSCIVALCYLRLIELRLNEAKLKMTANSTMEHMRKLHSCLCWNAGMKKPVRMIEDPTETQSAILKAFSHKVVDGVLLKETP